MSAIEDLSVKIQSLQDQLMAARESLYAARLERDGLIPGKTVILSVAGDEFLLTEANYSGTFNKRDDKPYWLHGKKKLKNGSWGELSRHIYSGWAVKP